MSRNTQKRSGGRNHGSPKSASRPKRDKAGRSHKGGADRQPSPSLPAGAGDAYWLYGNHPVQAALANPERTILRMACTAGQLEDYTNRTKHLPVSPEKVDRDQLDALFPEGTVHQGVAALVRPLAQLAIEDILFSARERSVIVVLDQVTDPHNVGAVLRSAAVFGADAVILPDRNAPPETGVLAKSASGALESVPLVRITNLARALDQMKEKGFWSMGLAGEGDIDLPSFDLPERLVVVMGAEGSGLRRLTRDHCDHLVRIPMAENAVGSLNVSNAAAIVLYDVTSRQGR